MVVECELVVVPLWWGRGTEQRARARGGLRADWLRHNRVLEQGWGSTSRAREAGRWGFIVEMW